MATSFTIPENLKVEDLVKILLQCDQKSPVEIAIRQYNKVYPIAYVNIEGACDRQNGVSTRVIVSLPNNMRTRTIKS